MDDPIWNVKLAWQFTISFFFVLSRVFWHASVVHNRRRFSMCRAAGMAEPGLGGFWPSTILSANYKTAELLKQVFDKVEKI